MDRIKELLSRRVFGVPVGVFVVLGAAVLLYFALRMKRAPATPDETATDEPSGDADPFGGDKGNPVFQASPVSSTVIAQPAQDTNELWAGRARTWLVGQGVGSLAAQAMVYKYLNSQTLTAAERVKIDQLLSVLGFPPDPPDPIDDDTPQVEDPPLPPDPGPPAPTDAPDPVNPGGGGVGGNNTPPTKQGEPPTMHKVVNARDNGPGELAVLYFGNNSPATVNKIEAANLDIGNGPWAVGTKVKIPANVEPHYFTATANVRGLNELAAKNGVTREYIKQLNPGMDFPVRVGTRVRVR